jgi:hypothetical protein
MVTSAGNVIISMSGSLAASPLRRVILLTAAKAPIEIDDEDELSPSNTGR